jgi:hypothetical protein
MVGDFVCDDLSREEVIPCEGWRDNFGVATGCSQVVCVWRALRGSAVLRTRWVVPSGDAE